MVNTPTVFSGLDYKKEATAIASIIVKTPMSIFLLLINIIIVNSTHQRYHVDPGHPTF
ncbi:hypothetical protein Hanom_Chr08g00702541 [Helianthus anomalus]